MGMDKAFILKWDFNQYKTEVITILLILVLLFWISSCASSRYEVVEKLGEGKYHVVNKYDVIIYKTTDKLIIGQKIIIR